MNTILTEIAIKAKVEHCISHVRLQNFAELIVQECIRKIEDIAESSNDPQPIYRVAVELLEHFGVEE